MSVKVYSTPTCPFCIFVKRFLKKKNIEFEDIDVSKNREMAVEMMVKSGQNGVPVIDFDGNIVVGFNRRKLNELIKNKE